MNLDTTTERQNAPSVEEVESLAAAFSEFTGSRTSDGFYRKAISALGPGLAREAMGEVKMRFLEGEVEDKARYMTTVLKNWMKERDLDTSPGTPDPGRALTQSPTTLDDFKPLPLFSDEIPINFAGADREMTVPYSPDLFQWASHLGNEFFTLTNDKAKADQAIMKLDIAGLEYKVPMLRGKLYREDREERGIPTTEHMRILHAVEAIWALRRGPHEIDSKGFALCKIMVPVFDIAQYLGLSPGGREYKRIIEKAVDLSTTGYVFLTKDLPGYTHNGKTLEDVPFKFFGEVKPMTVRDNATGRRTKYLRIIFTEQYSRWLLSGRVVSRPLELLKKRGDIAFKLAVYLFPILKKRKEHSIELNDLIDKIGLRRMGWSGPYGFKSQRKREFEKATKELNGLASGDGRFLSISFDQGLNAKDFMLIAKFISVLDAGG